MNHKNITNKAMHNLDKKYDTHTHTLVQEHTKLLINMVMLKLHFHLCSRFKHDTCGEPIIPFWACYNKSVKQTVISRLDLLSVPCLLCCRHV